MLGPILLWQGRNVRRDILRLPEAEGPRKGVLGDGPPLRLLILGDSAAAGVGAATQDEALSGGLVKRLAPGRCVSWRLIAKTGWTTVDAQAALAEVDEPFDVVVLSLGVNDVTTETGLTRWLATYESLCQVLVEKHGVKTILASALPPMGEFAALPQPLRWYMGLQATAHDKALADWAARTARVLHLTFEDDLSRDDMAEDGFHPGPNVYAAWAARAAAALDEVARASADSEPRDPAKSAMLSADGQS